MKPYQSRRRYYVRLKSRHGRNGLGYHRYEVLWRHQEETKFKRFERRANELILARKPLREADPQVFYQSPFIPRPYYDLEHFLPCRWR